HAAHDRRGPGPAPAAPRRRRQPAVHERPRVGRVHPDQLRELELQPVAQTVRGGGPAARGPRRPGPEPPPLPGGGRRAFGRLAGTADMSHTKENPVLTLRAESAATAVPAPATSAPLAQGRLPRESASSLYRSGEVRVLVVDDDPAICRVIQA